MQNSVSVRLLKLTTSLMIGVLLVFAAYSVWLLLIAMFVPSHWPDQNTLTTAIRGFDLPTKMLKYQLIFIGRQVATLSLAALLILPIAGIVRSFDRHGPFTSANVTRLRLLALGCAIYGLGPLLSPLVPIDVRIPLGLLHAFINWPAAAMTLVALVLAEIFREGICLREDTEKTI